MSSEEQAGGCWVLVVGPSGAGKDTLIDLAREQLSADESIRFARRVVTRPSNEFEDHDTVSTAEFAALEDTGRLALSWSAHGLRYGVASEWADELEQGNVVVCNVSRKIVADTKAQYPVVRTVLITAPDDVLAARIAIRGRDSASGSRTTRDLNALVEEQADLVIQNTGPPEEGASRLVRFLRTLANSVVSE